MVQRTPTPPPGRCQGLHHQIVWWWAATFPQLDLDDERLSVPVRMPFSLGRQPGLKAAAVPCARRPACLSRASSQKKAARRGCRYVTCRVMGATLGQPQHNLGVLLAGDAQHKRKGRVRGYGGARPALTAPTRILPAAGGRGPEEKTQWCRNYGALFSELGGVGPFLVVCLRLRAWCLVSVCHGFGARHGTENVCLCMHTNPGVCVLHTLDDIRIWLTTLPWAGETSVSDSASPLVGAVRSVMA